MNPEELLNPDQDQESNHELNIYYEKGKENSTIVLKIPIKND